jgi:transposase
MSHQQIAAALGISKGVVTKYVGLAAAAGLDWPEVQEASESVLERRLLATPERPRDHVQPDYGRLHQGLRRKGMTLMLLWEQYRADHAGSQTYGYSQFCEHYRRFAKRLKRSMRYRTEPESGSIDLYTASLAESSCLSRPAPWPHPARRAAVQS